jgi:hypothetical protein
MHLLAPANARNLRSYKREAPDEVDVLRGLATPSLPGGRNEVAGTKQGNYWANYYSAEPSLRKPEERRQDLQVPTVTVPARHPAFR